MRSLNGLAAAGILALGAIGVASLGRGQSPPSGGVRLEADSFQTGTARQEPFGSRSTGGASGPDVGPGRKYGWPSGGAVPVLRGFDPPGVRWGRGHRGVDLAMDEGQPVLAAGDGVVLHAGMLVDRPIVSIEHAGGMRTTYEPVEPAVSAGQRVSRGDVVGRLRGGHCSGKTRLHWGAKRGSDGYVDPLSLLRPPLIRLLE